MNPLMQLMVWIMFFFIFGHSFAESAVYAICTYSLIVVIEKIWRNNDLQ